MIKIVFKISRLYQAAFLFQLPVQRNKVSDPQVIENASRID
jgi:hypothetical protein